MDKEAKTQQDEPQIQMPESAIVSPDKSPISSDAGGLSAESSQPSDLSGVSTETSENYPESASVSSEAEQPPSKMSAVRDRLHSLLPRSFRGISKIALLILAVIATGYFATALITNFAGQKMIWVKYSNGKGASFRLKYYNQSSLGTAPNSVLSAYDKKTGAPNSIRASTGKNGKLPLAMTISTIPMTKARESSLTKNGGCGLGLVKFGTTNIASLNKDVPICGIRHKGKIYLVVTPFKQGKVYYAPTFYHYVPREDGKTKAADSSRYDLSDYQKDISNIVSSIIID